MIPYDGNSPINGMLWVLKCIVCKQMHSKQCQAVCPTKLYAVLQDVRVVCEEGGESIYRVGQGTTL